MSAMPEHREAVSVDEMAAMYGVHRHSVLAEIRSGRLRAFKFGPGWRIHRRELDRWVELRMREGREPVIRRIGAA